MKVVQCWRRIAGSRNGMDRQRQRGQALIELAFIIPFLLPVFMGAIDLGRIFYTYTAISNAAYAAARQAARGGYLYQACVPNIAGNACDATAMLTQLCPSTDPGYQTDAGAGLNYKIVTIYASLKCELGSLFNDYVTDTSHINCITAQLPDPTISFPAISSPNLLTAPVGGGCVGWGYNLGTDASGAQEVTVTVTYNFVFLTPAVIVFNGPNNYFTLQRTVSVAVLTAPGNAYPTPTPSPTP